MKNVATVVACFAVCAMMMGCEDEEEQDVVVKSIAIAPAENVSVEAGKTVNLTATVSPENATNKKVTWSSLNQNFATVDAQTGVVTGVSAGQATIRATANDSGKATDDKNVTVTAPPVVAVTLESIAVTTQPAKKEYFVNEKFDTAEMVVTATYSDGSTETVTITADMLTYDFSTAGENKTVTITYEGKTATVTGITVIDKDDEYTIKYRPGTHSSGEEYTQPKNKGEDVTLRGATYTRSGFTQTGWSTKENGSTKDYSLEETYSDDADLTLFPFWKDDDDDDDDPDTDYNLPTNFKYTHETTGIGYFIAETVIKIGENYYYKREFSGIVYERYMKQNTNGTWTDYTKNNFAMPSIWELETEKPLNATEKIREIEISYINSVLWGAGDLSSAVKGGKETIAGVSTDVYTLGDIVLNQDPVTKLFFKIVDPLGGTFVVTSWDTSVTSFGITGLP